MILKPPTATISYLNHLEKREQVDKQGKKEPKAAKDCSLPQTTSLTVHVPVIQMCHKSAF